MPSWFSVLCLADHFLSVFRWLVSWSLFVVIIVVFLEIVTDFSVSCSLCPKVLQYLERERTISRRVVLMDTFSGFNYSEAICGFFGNSEFRIVRSGNEAV